MKARAGLFCLLFGAIWLGGCAHSAGSQGAAEGAVDLAAYLPLAVGNQWTYATSFQGQPQADLTVKIVEKQGPYFLDDRHPASHYVFDAEGLRDGAKRYLLKLPLVDGTEWMSVADLNTVERYRIVDAARKVQVPAGVFDKCVVVQMEVRMQANRAMRNEMTFAPGVGVISIQTTLLDGAKSFDQSSLKLKTYKVK
jgi:hypothetical protein